ncbi:MULTISPECIES: DUF6880 family protein [unclassified Yoonia]|uniref:DUF6880 family protein n=1 Tax=unclassified Yoonia TaxID=2629118 RepID=UPI002AFE5818|nr:MULTISPECIES: DUF6880 family protein [unclassified Yoonia]
MQKTKRVTKQTVKAAEQRVENIRTALNDLVRPFSPYTRSTVRRRYCDVFRQISRVAELASPEVTITLLLDALSHHEALANRRGFEEKDDRAIRASIDAALATIISLLPPASVPRLPSRMMRAVGDNRRGALSLVVRRLVPYLDAKACARWNGLLARRPPKKPHPYLVPQQKDHLVARQLLARAAKQPDLYAFLERERYGECNGRSVLVAQVYLESGRPVDAMAHLPEPNSGTIEPPFMSLDVEMECPRRRVVEADIFEALGDLQTAQMIRHEVFEETLSVPALRAYLKHQNLSGDFDAEDWAMGVAAAFGDPRRSVRFFCDWGRPDLARTRIFDDAVLWDRPDDWGALTSVDSLCEAEPIAATVVLRALVRFAWKTGDPLYRPLIARWVRKLAVLASRVEGADMHRQEGLSTHAVFLKMMGMMPNGKRQW